MADINNYYAARHAPAADFSDPTPIRKRPVGSFSRPASDSDVQGTGALLSGPKQHRSRGGQVTGTVQEVASPLDLSAGDDIIAASGLGVKADDRTWAEKASDADSPTQAVKTQADGSMVHHRADPSTGRVLSTPVGAYSSKPRFRGQFSNSGDLNYFPNGEG